MVTDELDDAPTLIGFPRYTKYVLTGAPWAAPVVTGVVSGGAGGTVPLDGGGTVARAYTRSLFSSTRAVSDTLKAPYTS